MKITEFVERVSETELIVTGRVSVGFGMSADYAPRHDRVKIVPTAEFERLLAECKPSGVHSVGYNRGAPLDGLVEWSGKSGIRYLADATGSGVHYKFADAATVPAN